LRQKLTEEEKIGYTSDIALVSSYLAESTKFDIILPTVLVDDKLELKQENGRSIFCFSASTYGADLVVCCP
jgi:hypothetical protein